MNEAVTKKQLPVTMVIVNFNTPDLTQRAVTSFRHFYPDINLILIDNGSSDNSIATLHHVQQQHPDKTEVIRHARNLHHGPAMDAGVRNAATPHVMFLDSDCEVQTGGFVETMLASLASDPANYAAGKKIFMNHSGFDTDDEKNGIPYIRPFCMMLKRDMYFLLPPFRRHGSPCLANMRTAMQRGYRLIDYPVEQFVKHEGRGTAGAFGYHLGLKGKLNYLLNKMGI